MKKAVVLLSGGLDSTTALAIAKSRGFELYALSFDYGQRHRHELSCAGRTGLAVGVKQWIVAKIDILRMLGGSALTSSTPVPKGRTEKDMGADIPVTYVPARNTIFLSYATAWAEVLGAADIFIGVNILDYSGYPDCRPEFIASFQATANLATRAGVTGATKLTIHAPLINWTKAEIIKAGLALGVDYSTTSSCYDPHADGRPCGKCDSCILRRKGFKEAGSSDPLVYTL